MPIKFQKILQPSRKKNKRASETMMRSSRRITFLVLAILSLRILSSWEMTARLHYASWCSFEIPSRASSSISNNETFTRVPSREYPSVVLGDLPGYTGWPRPSYTEAPFYEIEWITPPARRKAHEVLTVMVHCSKCTTMNFAQFYVRMYGPSILTGHVIDMNKGRYEITFLPRIPGKYWIEVVLTFSKGEDVGSYPIKKKEPAYEGYLLPNFPLAVEVFNTGDQIDDSIPFEDRRCGARDLLVKENKDGMNMAAWQITSKINDISHIQHPSPKRRKAANYMTDGGYQEGRNSLGIFSEYQPVNCNLVAKNKSFVELSHNCSWSQFHSKRIRIVFVGDSNLRLQREHFVQLQPTRQIKTSYISTYGGLLESIVHIRSKLSVLDFENEDIVLIFNSGLHDISVLCSSFDFRAVQRKNYVPADYTCAEEYKNALTELTTMVSSFSARVKLFQTTSAGWMRWGNFGFVWPMTLANQSFPQSTHFVDVFNHVAFRVLGDFDDIDIMDGYWITLARPDNREIGEENVIGKHLVHPGLEVQDALVRTWTTIILSKLGC